MHEYQKRVVEEQKELSEKILKLTTVVIQNDIINCQDDEESLLYRQLQIMLEYNKILQMRIKSFNFKGA